VVRQLNTAISNLGGLIDASFYDIADLMKKEEVVTPEAENQQQ
jgi:hypothetical protein